MKTFEFFIGNKKNVSTSYNPQNDTKIIKLKRKFSISPYAYIIKTNKGLIIKIKNLSTPLEFSDLETLYNSAKNFDEKFKQYHLEKFDYFNIKDKTNIVTATIETNNKTLEIREPHKHFPYVIIIQAGDEIFIEIQESGLLKNKEVLLTMNDLEFIYSLATNFDQNFDEYYK